MPPLNLLLLPLLGGFIFVSRWHVSRFVVLRSEGYRLLFHSAIAGLTLLFLSAITISALTNLPPKPRLVLLNDLTYMISTGWHQVAPMSYSGTAVLALIIGSLIWMPLNYLVLYKSHYIDSVIERKGDPLELMLRRAMGEGKPLRFNLKNDKVYVGFVTSNFNPIFQSEYLKILPIVSGNTDQTAAKAMCGKDYRPIYAQMHGSAKREAESGESRKKSYEDLFQHIERVVSLRDLEVLIPITELQSVECLQVNRTDSSGIDASIGPQ